MLILLTALQFLCLRPATPNHALYIGVVQIMESAEAKGVSVRVKVFTDDLQDAIRNFDASFLPADNANFCQQNKQAITDYFNQHLKCSLDDKGQSLRFEKATLENDVFFLHFKIDQPLHWRKFSVFADFFMELFPSQSNIIQIQKGADKHYGRVTSDDLLFKGSF